MKQRYTTGLAALACLCLLFSGCGQEEKKPQGPPRDAAALVLEPKAQGSEVFENDIVTLDSSNIKQGYVMLKYRGSAEKVKVIIAAPDGASYSYPINTGDSWHTFPLSQGDGSYKISVYEGIPNEERSDLYSSAFTTDVEAVAVDSFKPFLYPNRYVNFTADSAAVKKGEELAADCYSDLDVIENIYNFVVKNVKYDDALAESVSFGYLPEVDRTLETKKGICFDYAALMACMLRSQRIPTKLVVGYSGESLHAWISAYIEGAGWIDNLIEFTGKEWKLLDPTLAANNSSSKKIAEYIGDGSHYLVKYQY